MQNKSESFLPLPISSYEHIKRFEGAPTSALPPVFTLVRVLVGVGVRWKYFPWAATVWGHSPRVWVNVSGIAVVIHA